MCSSSSFSRSENSSRDWSSPCSRDDLDRLVVHRDRLLLELVVGLELRAHVRADVQVQILHLRRRVEEQQPLDDLLGMLHLVDRLLADEAAKLVIAPVVAHLRVQEVLVDGRELLPQRILS